MAQVQIVLEWNTTGQVLSRIVDLHDGKGAKGLVELSADLDCGRWSKGTCKVSSVVYDEGSLEIAVNLDYNPLELGTPHLLLNLSGFSLDRGLSLSFPAQRAAATPTMPSHSASLVKHEMAASTVVVRLGTWGVDAKKSCYSGCYGVHGRYADPQLLEMQLSLHNLRRMRSVMNRYVRLVVQREDGRSPADAVHTAMIRAGCKLNFSAFAYTDNGSQEMKGLFHRMLRQLLTLPGRNVAANCTEVYFYPPRGLVGAPHINGSMLDFLQWALEREKQWTFALEAVLREAASNEDNKVL
eukprot:6331977-Amphidinium_carterae.1